MARPNIRKATRSRPPGKRTSLPASVAAAVIQRLFTAAGSGRGAQIVTAAAKRRPGALSHPAARGKSAGQRAPLAVAVASAVAGRLAAAAPGRAAPARAAAKPRAGLAAAVASAVAEQLAGRAASRRR